MGACLGFTFGSVVSRDLLGLTWNAAGDILVIIEFSLVLAMFFLTCFADKSPDYTEISCRNIISRLLLAHHLCPIFFSSREQAVPGISFLLFQPDVLLLVRHDCLKGDQENHHIG